MAMYCSRMLVLNSIKLQHSRSSIINVARAVECVTSTVTEAYLYKIFKGRMFVHCADLQGVIMSASAGKIVVVMLESLAGTGHRLFRNRPKVAEKLEFIHFDPYVQQKVLYKETKRLKTLRSKGK